MRAGAVAVVAVVCAVLGGAAALALGKAAGWVDVTRVETVVVSTATEPPTAAPTAAKPLPGGVFDPQRIFTERASGVVTIYATFGGTQSQGSGFVTSSDGHILTNAHVITNAGEVTPEQIRAADTLYVEFADRDRVPARVVGWDVFDDVGLIQVDPEEHALAPLPLGDSAGVTVGMPVAAIGSPFGNEGSLSVGVVSATRRSIDSLTSLYQLVDAIQTDAPINRGNSGGPLFDASGRVIGINAQIRSDSGASEGVGFAVPINSARRSMEQLIANGRVAYAYVGITSEGLTPALAEHFGYEADYGAVVTSVGPDSPAAKAGLRSGSDTEDFLGARLSRGADVIVDIEGTPIRAAEDVVRVVTEQLRPGQVARFTVVRGSQRITLDVRVAERPLQPRSG